MYKDIERAQLNGIYKRAKARCTNPNTSQFMDYGGRGIEFRFTSFEEFLTDLGPRPVGYSLDRINNDGHYEVGNVRWATRQQQNNNKRMYKTNQFGITGIHYLPPKNKYKTPRFCARVITEDGRKEVYKGPDFFEACCAIRSYQCLNS